MSWDWHYVGSILPALLQGLETTVQVAFLAYGLAFVVGIGMAVLRWSKITAIRCGISTAIETIRRTPLLVQLYILFYVLPQIGVIWSPMVIGVIGLGLNYAAFMSEIFRAGIEGVPRGQWEAAAACNLSRAKTWRYVVLPQAVPPMIPSLANYGVAVFKETPILTMISVVELMNRAQIEANLSYRYLEPITLVGALFLAVSIPSVALTRLLERRIKAQQGR